MSTKPAILFISPPTFQTRAEAGRLITRERRNRVLRIPRRCFIGQPPDEIGDLRSSVTLARVIKPTAEPSFASECSAHARLTLRSGMVRSNSPRAKALRALKELWGPRANPENKLGELFPFGVLPPGFGGGTETKRDYDDRSIALITATVIEQSLEVAILTKLVPQDTEGERALFSEDGAPLASFDAKIRLAFALGLFGKAMKDDLAIIRNVRNSFAHSRLPITFDTPQIVNACEELTLTDRLGVEPTPDFVAREWYIFCSYQYSIYLINTSLLEEKKQTNLLWTYKVLDFAMASKTEITRPSDSSTRRSQSEYASSPAAIISASPPPHPPLADDDAEP